jgi:hypothetical protein
MRKDSVMTINPREIKTRDYNMLLIIAGATKAGVQKDRRKETSRKACRGKARSDGD